ncbi:ATP-binding protein [Shewanella sp. Isolate7]|uniref:AAA family ATPase n=1 Tax=Shewanella sp. Isolate7 TaxID=2908528 RepID=UPI001EFEBE0B|nr:ATP-binding protein [Shewanella sp. Isolate7]MCG9722142.1 ATP-binding protein [Shewanella sp. Isolate7]
MKHKIVEVKNVLSCLELMENLQGRSSITPGIGLVHGPSGFGKTTTMCWLINQLGARNASYVRCYATDTPSSFIARIMEELGADMLYPLRKSVDFIVNRMNERQLPLFIDEADHIVGQSRIMETIRDLYDATELPVILVGMEEIARRISHRKQLFNRVSEWVEFQPADLEDVHEFASQLLDDRVQVAEDLLEHIRKRSGGEVRRILTALEKIERSALANDLDFVDLDAWGEQPLFLEFRR